MKRHVHGLLLGATLLTACPGGEETRGGGGGGGNNPGGGDNPGGTPAGRLPADTRSHSASGSSWTLLVYMVADNNLEPFALTDLEEMAQVGSSNGLNLIVQIDRAEGYSSAGLPGLPDFTSVKRLKVEPGQVVELADLGELNMGERGALTDFLSWGLRTYPAGRVGLVLWDHGGAWPGFGGDESTQNLDVLDLAELKQGLSEGLAAGGKDQLALIGFDACLMATYETALSLRTFGEYLLASEELEPGHGWDYRSLARAKADPSIAPRALGEELIRGFKAQAVAEQTERNVTLSLTDLHRVAELSNSIADLADALKTKAASQGPALGQMRAEVLEFGKAPDPSRSTNMVDLADLARRTAAADASLSGLRDRLLATLGQAVLAKESGPLTAGAGGLSLYYPPQASLYQAAYDQVEAVEAWRAFIKGYHQAGQSAGAGPTFTNEGHQAEVFADGEELVIQGQLAAGAGADVARAALSFGLFDSAAQKAYLLGELPAAVGDEERVEGRWDKKILTLAQGPAVAVGFYQIEVEGSYVSAQIPFGYAAPGAQTLDYVLLSYVMDLETGSEQSTYYLVTEGGPGELLPEAGSSLYPLVLEVGTDSAAWRVSAEQPFDGGAPIETSLEPLREGTEVFLQLSVQSFGGGGDYVAFIGAM